MLSHDISKEQVKQFTEKLKQKFTYDSEENRNLIKKGLLLYRQGSVYNVKATRSGNISGRVQDVTPVDVELDLEFLEMSTCSCPANDFCRHQMGLFFSVYASFDRIGSLLEDWKNQNTPQFTIDKMKETTKKKEFDDYSLNSWIAYFNREYTNYLVGYPVRNQFFFSKIYHTFYQTLRRKAPLSQELKGFYHLHAALFCIEKSLELIDELDLRHYQMDTYVRPYFHNFTDIVLENCEQLKQYSLPFSMDSLLEDSIERVRDTLLGKQHFQFERILMYRTIWVTLLNRNKWIEKEAAYLIELEKTPHFSGDYFLSFVHNLFLQKKDELAIMNLENNGSQMLSFTFWWIGYLTDTKDWDRARIWIDYSLRNFPPYINSIQSFDSRRGITRSYLRELENYADQHDETIYVKAMRQLLPYSYYEYDSYLQETKEYHQWVELQMLVGYDVDECDRQVIREIENKDRAALLPFYHHAITNAIELKNRMSYKKAVKYLKKVRTTYKKIKREDLWESYITKLAASKKRLRAFQEELVRASLISKD